jgi:hypothetical protein
LTTPGISALSVFFSRLKDIPKTLMSYEDVTHRPIYFPNSISRRKLYNFILSCGVNVEQKVLSYVDDALERLSQMFYIPDVCLAIARTGNITDMRFRKALQPS